MRQRTMLIILLFLVLILIILWWLTLRRETVQPPVPAQSIVSTVPPQDLAAPTTPAQLIVPTTSPSPTISPTSVPFASPPGLIVPTASPGFPSPTAAPAPVVVPPTITVEETIPPASPVAKVAELVVEAGILPGSMKYQYRYRGDTQKFSFEDDDLIIAFPTSIPNRFRLVTSSLEDSYDVVKVYDRNVVSGENTDVWTSPVFYIYVTMYGGKIYLFGGSNDASPQDIISHNIQTSESKLLAGDVGNIEQIEGNTITYNVYAEIPFNDEDPNQEIPIGPEKTIILD